MPMKKQCRSWANTDGGRFLYGQERINYMTIVTENPPSVKPDFSIDALIDAGTVAKSDDKVTPKIVGDLLALALAQQGVARRTVFDSAKSLVGRLPTDERNAHEITKHLYAELKTKDAVDQWLESCPAPVGKSMFQPMGLAGLMARPPKQWYINDIMGPGDMGMLYGPPGSGKTFVGIDMIFAACLGQTWAQRFPVNALMNVAYCAGEGVSGLAQRFHAAAKHYGVNDLPNFTFFDTVPQLYTEDMLGGEIASIRRFVHEWLERQEKGEIDHLDLLVLDTLHSAATGAEENSSKEMGLVLSVLKEASRALGCAVLLVHHTNKGGVAERGTTALRGAMDFMIRVEPKDGKYAMHCEKLKDGERWKEQDFDLTAMADSVVVWWEKPTDSAEAKSGKEDKEAIKAEMKRYPGTRFTVKSLAEAIGKSENYTRNLLSELEKAKECKRELSDPGKGQSPRNPWVYFMAG